MAASKSSRKSASRKSAARKSPRRRPSKKAKTRAAPRKAAKTRKRRPSVKKAPATSKRRAAARKAPATRGKKAAAPARAKTIAASRPAVFPDTTEIDNRIAIVRANLRELVEQAASFSGAANEELMSQRIAEQEATLEALTKQREGLARRA